MATASHQVSSTIAADAATHLAEEAGASDMESGAAVTDFPCSVSQERFWLLDRLEPGNASYNVAVRWRLEGRISTELLEEAWREIISRHEILRTHFLEVDGKPIQRVAPRSSFKLTEIDLATLPADGRSAEADRIGLIEARAPFDLSTGPLLRVMLLRHSPTTAVILITTHQIVSDGWSIGVMAREMGAIYEALSRQKDIQLEPLAIQYGDYASWQLEWLRERGTDAETQYWSRQLEAVVPFEVVADRPRPAVPTTNGAIASLVLPRDLTTKMQALSAERGVTLFSAVVATLCATLSRYTGKTEIVIGTQVSERDQVELEPMIGQFVNSLILRNHVDGDPTFQALLDRVSTTISAALEHRHIPIERLLGMVKAGRGGSDSPPVSINFIFQRTFIENRQYSDFALIDLPSLPAGAIYDLNFFMVERPDGWRFSCQYNTDQFEADTATRLLNYFQAALRSAVENPARPVSQLWLDAPAQVRAPETTGLAPREVVASTNGERLVPLLRGARIAPLSSSDIGDTTRLQQALRRTHATVLDATGIEGPLLLKSLAGFNGKVLFDRSNTARELIAQLLSRGVEAWAAHNDPQTGLVAINRIRQLHDLRLLGQPLTGISFLVLDHAGQVPPVGAAGKLYIDRNGERFPTSDLARIRADGSVELINDADILLSRSSKEVEQVAPDAGAPVDAATERELTAIWSELLQQTDIDPTANFFELGGHSLLAARMLARVETRFGRRITLGSLFRAPTLRGLARLLHSNARDFDFRQMVKLQSDGANLPLIAINNTGVYYLLAKRLGPQQPVTSLQLFDPAAKHEALPDTLEKIAAEYVKLIRRVHPQGPYLLAGWCVAGALAFEIARQLTEGGHVVSNVFLIDSWVPRYFERLPGLRRAIGTYSLRWQLARADWRNYRSGRQSFQQFLDQRPSLGKLLQVLRRISGQPVAPAHRDAMAGAEEYDRWLLEYLKTTTHRYEPRTYGGRVTLLRSREEPTGWLFDPHAGWGRFVDGGIELAMVDGNHFTMFQDPGATQMAQRMGPALTAAPQST
jgi:thioesterase domain-containing protein